MSRFMRPFSLPFAVATLDRVDQDEVNRQLAVAQSALDKETVNAAWARGQNMSSEDAIAYALSEQGANS